MTSTILQQGHGASQGAGSLSICVFCGAGRSNSPAIVDTARATGRLIGERGHRLVYGGGGSGLMGEVAWAAAETGAAIRGIIPKFLYERELGISAPAQETHLTDSLNRRKELMLHSADAFLALPGGYGTLDEILEVISAAYLDVSAKPLVVVNVEGVWDHFLGLVATLQDFHLIAPREQPLFRAVDTAEDALDLIETMIRTTP
ncbi:TIGR00730 family Rossman fold protein [Nonomuraea sp. NPDC005650]|uniref:LOG family protein n=1 Tax=Nonomuraea sp. NPDC005650 TaxID=3157045 RepID=UPI0033BD484A